MSLNVVQLLKDQCLIINDIIKIADVNGLADKFDEWNVDNIEYYNNIPHLKVRTIGLPIELVGTNLIWMNNEQIKLLVKLIEHFRGVDLQPFYFDAEKGIVRSFSCNDDSMSIQKYLEEFLYNEKLPELKEKHEIFDQYHGEAKMTKVRFEVGEESCSPPTKPWNGLTEEEFERREREIADERMSRDNPEGPDFFY